jgi:hypothetical protein
LSETTKLSSKEIKGWLESETGSVFNPVHAKAQKLRDETRREFEEYVEVCKSLMENSGKEIEKRNPKTYRRARVMHKLARLFLSRIQHVQIPVQVTYDSLNEMAQETQKALSVTEVDIRNWFPRISPFFIMDRSKFQRVFTVTKEMLKELNNFLTKEYVKTKSLEETYLLADKLRTSEEQLMNAKEQKERLEGERAVVEKEIVETQQKITGLKNQGNLSQLNQINTEIEALNAEVKHNLQHLQKPFIKLQSLALHGGGSGLMQDESAKLNQYLENPFEALATEQAGYPTLRAILEKMDMSMSEKLNLKPEKERKAKQTIDSILKNNSLANLHQKCVNASSQKKQLSASPETAQILAELSKFQEHLETLERRKKVFESEESVARRACNETSEKIRAIKSEIEKKVFDSISKRVHIE